MNVSIGYLIGFSLLWAQNGDASNQKQVAFLDGQNRALFNGDKITVAIIVPRYKDKASAMDWLSMLHSTYRSDSLVSIRYLIRAPYGLSLMRPIAEGAVQRQLDSLYHPYTAILFGDPDDPVFRTISKPKTGIAVTVIDPSGTTQRQIIGEMTRDQRAELLRVIDAVRLKMKDPKSAYGHSND